jgi:hypothetical protein
MGRRAIRDPLIPSPPVIRERLANHVREARFLRALLRLSVRAEDARSLYEARGRGLPGRSDHETYTELNV